MASYDIDSIMAEHGLSKDEAAEVLRVLKSGPASPAADTCIYSVCILQNFVFVFEDFWMFTFFRGRVLHLQATPSPKSASAKDRIPSNRSQRIKFPASTFFCVHVFCSVFS